MTIWDLIEVIGFKFAFGIFDDIYSNSPIAKFDDIYGRKFCYDCRASHQYCLLRFFLSTGFC